MDQNSLSVLKHCKTNIKNKYIVHIPVQTDLIETTGLHIKKHAFLFLAYIEVVFIFFFSFNLTHTLHAAFL